MRPEGAFHRNIASELAEAPAPLCRLLPKASANYQKEILHALDDLRAETGEVVFPLLSVPRYPHIELALEFVMHLDTLIGALAARP